MDECKPLVPGHSYATLRALPHLVEQVDEAGAYTRPRFSSSLAVFVPHVTQLDPSMCPGCDQLEP